MWLGNLNEIVKQFVTVHVVSKLDFECFRTKCYILTKLLYLY